MAKITIMRPDDPAISVNSVVQGTIGLGEDIDIVTTQVGAPYVPDSIALVGNEITIDFPAGGGGGDNDAQMFLDAAGITDPTITSAIETLVSDLKTAEIWSKMVAIYPYVGGTATTHKFNLKMPIDSAYGHALLFAGGITHDANGVTFGGVNGSAQPRINGVTTEYSFGVYIGTNVSVNATDIFVNGAIHIFPKHNGTTTYHRGIGASPDNYANTDSRGLFHQYGRSALSTAYLNGTLKLTGGASSTGTEVMQFGAGSGFSSRRHQFAFVGTSLTDAKAVEYYDIIQAFQTALSRQVT